MKNKKKLSTKNLVLIIVASVILLIVAGICAVYFYFNGMLKKGQSGTLPEEVKTEAENKVSDRMRFLVCGIDFDADEGRDYADGKGMTDVMLYCDYNLKENSLKILQIPRDFYVGDITKNARLNLVYAQGESKEDPIANLAMYLKQNLGLSVDNYLTIDMSAFKEIINVFGGIEMYIPWDVNDIHGNVIKQGTRRLDGLNAEFVIRQRETYAQADYKRLEMQQYFYKAVFETIKKEHSLADIPAMGKIVFHFCDTDFSLMQLAPMFTKIFELKYEDIFISRCPGGPITVLNSAGKTESVFGINPTNLAELLNDNFLGKDEQVTADSLKIPRNFEYKLGEVYDKGHFLGDLDIDEDGSEIE